MSLIEKWKKTGLLRGLRGSQELKCALVLESTVEFLKNTEQSRFVNGALIPTVRRIFSTIENINFIRVSEILDSKDETNEDITYYAIDRECEIIADTAEEYIKEHE